MPTKPNLSDVSDSDLEKELARRKAHQDAPKLLDKPDFTALRECVTEGVNEFAETGDEDDDFEHYVYEAAMEALYGKDIWKWYNARVK